MASVVLYLGDSISSIMMTLPLLLLIKNVSSQDECRELSCGPDEPLIRFPFELVKGMQDGRGLRRSNLSFFNCSSVGHRHLRNYMQSRPDAHDMISCPIYVSDSYDSILKMDLTSCTKMFDIIAPVKAFYLQENFLGLRWFKPNRIEGDIECFDANGHGKGSTFPDLLFTLLESTLRSFDKSKTLAWVAWSHSFNGYNGRTIYVNQKFSTWFPPSSHWPSPPSTSLTASVSRRRGTSVLLLHGRADMRNYKQHHHR
ncbi:hypothetical protein Fmac_032058 [Flemingia macrophylla]|uniref:Uncharacterized protein n=1 Tax=Flemingia macrophylla TaxID=520843 RepID=A0ABD1L3T6_9FABA